MEKYKFTYNYCVIVEADNENQAVGKAADILGRLSELSLKLWLVTHAKIEPVIENNGVNLDGFPL